MLALTVTDTQCQWGVRGSCLLKLVDFSCSIQFDGAFSTKVVIFMQVLWIQSGSGRIRNFPDPENIIPDPGSSGSEMNLNFKNYL